MVLQEFERQWLDDHGGRSECDVNVDDNGDKYVYMLTMRGDDRRVYLPPTKVDYERIKKQRA